MKGKGVSIILGTYNRIRFLKLTIESVRRELDNFSYEIIVVDGGSTDGTLKWLVKQKDIIVIVQHNRGEWRGREIERRSWGYFMNLGFKAAQGKYICMLSDDCLVVPGAVINGYNLFESEIKKGKKIGALAFYWRNWPEQEKYMVGLTLGNKMFVNHGMYLKEAIENVGFIDEKRYFFYHADGDLCLKLWEKEYECIAAPDSYIEHYSHANRKIRRSNMEKQKEDKSNYLNKWRNIYYDGTDETLGSWIEKNYSDESKTCYKFKKARFFNTLKQLIFRS